MSASGAAPLAPKRLVKRTASRVLAVEWPDGRVDALPWEFLRVHSPSAEVQGHGSPQTVPGKRNVGLTRIEPVGRYAVRLVFDDGHDSGLFGWDLLRRFGENYEMLWQGYLDKLKALGMSRDSDVMTLRSLHYPAD